MPERPRYRPVVAAVASLALCCAAGASAQESWYRVEMLVFSNPQGLDSEAWPPVPELAYPQRGRFLVDPQRLAAATAKHGGRGVLDEYGRLIITLGGRGGADIPATASAATIGGDELQASPAALPTPFVVLPQQELTLRREADALQSRGGSRTLLHAAWVQPVTDSARALSVIIDHSGDGGPWPELQGSVRLYQTRQLQLQTDLWLNTSGDYLPGSWRMPPPPRAPTAIVVEDAINELGFTTPVATDEDAVDGAAEPPSGATSYPYRHAILLQQTRRVRTGALNYVDHPVLGMLVRVTPATAEELHALAQAEQAAAQLPPAELP